MAKEEKKVSIPEALQHISNTLTNHAEIIQTIQEKLDSLQPQIQYTTNVLCGWMLSRMGHNHTVVFCVVYVVEVSNTCLM
jgi:mannose/fructose/N-acetylgalactosamine-specific phosphotransferase system component IID